MTSIRSTRRLSLRRAQVQCPAVDATMVNTWDTNANACSLCQAKIGKRFFNPRHHCRLCGKNVCGRCSPDQLRVQGQLQRACFQCVEKLVTSDQAEAAQTPFAEVDAEFRGSVPVVVEPKAGVATADENVAAEQETSPRLLQDRLQQRQGEDEILKAKDASRRLEQVSPMVSEAVELKDVANDSLVEEEAGAAALAREALVEQETALRLLEELQRDQGEDEALFAEDIAHRVEQVFFVAIEALEFEEAATFKSAATLHAMVDEVIEALEVDDSPAFVQPALLEAESRQ